jgi:pimeloyl-ACP methyl ester carboxylesterase
MSERVDIPANGIRLATFRSGRADGPPLVLLPALGEPSATWDEIAPELGRDYQLIAIDLRGHGDSEWPGEYSFELIRDDVLGALDQLGLEQVSIIGHSLGGTVASLVAQARPALVRQLVLEDTAPPKPAGPAPAGEQADRPRTMPAPPPEQLPVDWPLVVAIGGQLKDPDPAWWAGLPSITARTLIIAGGEDSHVPQVQLAEAAQLIPDATLITIPAGHRVHTSRPAEFTAAVLAFLRAG